MENEATLDHLSVGSNQDAYTKDAYTKIEGALEKGLILVCDHACNVLPEGYGTLGLPAPELERHIAYDIGVAGVTKRLSAQLGVPAILSSYSRLLIDLNRSLDDPTLIMQLSDGAIVPGNANIKDREVETRIAKYYAPYHAAIDALINQALGTGQSPVLLSIHSFTENWKGVPRPWHATVLWDKDPRLPVPLIKALKRNSKLVIGENVPYTGELKGDCMYEHGTRRGLAHALIEIRQDLIRDEKGQEEWANRLAGIFDELMTTPELKDSLRQVQYYGSHTDMALSA